MKANKEFLTQVLSIVHKRDRRHYSQMKDGSKCYGFTDVHAKGTKQNRHGEEMAINWHITRSNIPKSKSTHPEYWYYGYIGVTTTASGMWGTGRNSAKFYPDKASFEKAIKRIITLADYVWYTEGLTRETVKLYND